MKKFVILIHILGGCLELLMGYHFYSMYFTPGEYYDPTMTDPVLGILAPINAMIIGLVLGQLGDDEDYSKSFMHWMIIIFSVTGFVGMFILALFNSVLLSMTVQEIIWMAVSGVVIIGFYIFFGIILPKICDKIYNMCHKPKPTIEEK